jgi:hypothetical protein
LRICFSVIGNGVVDVPYRLRKVPAKETGCAGLLFTEATSGSAALKYNDTLGAIPCLRALLAGNKVTRAVSYDGSTIQPRSDVR